MPLKNKKFFVVYVTVILTMTILFIKSNWDQATNAPPATNDVGISNRKFVFMDLGVGPGTLLLDFFGEQRHFSEFMRRKLLNEREWTVYGFEANPHFDDTLEKLSEQLRSQRSMKIKMFKQTAAWIHDGEVTFYLDTVNELNNFWGSSLKANHPDVVASGNKSIQVRSIDIANLLAVYSKDDFVVLAIDIEGGEYELLAHLIRRDVVRLIDYLVVAFHPGFETKDKKKSLEEALQQADVKINFLQ